MKVELQFDFKRGWFRYAYIKLARVKLVDDEWKYVKFLKLDDDLMDKIEWSVIDLENWRKRVIKQVKSRRKTPWQRELF